MEALYEYHDQPRIPFEEYGSGHSFIDEFVDWIQYSSTKGTLHRPKIQFKNGLWKGCNEYVQENSLTGNLSTPEAIFDHILNDPIIKQLVFNQEGNMYVERAMEIDFPNDDAENVMSDNLSGFFEQLVKDYESNPGGCWAFLPGTSNAYCGYGTINVVLRGYVSLDDVYWKSFVRLFLRPQQEYEVRTYPNGRVQIEEIEINGQVISSKYFDGPRIIRSTFLGNNQTFKGKYAKLGYEKDNYKNNFIDREGNEYNFSLSEYVEDMTANQQMNIWDIVDDIYEIKAVGKVCFLIELHKKFNIFDPEQKKVLLNDWYDKLGFPKYGLMTCQIEFGKCNYIRLNDLSYLFPDRNFAKVNDFGHNNKPLALVSDDGTYNMLVDVNGNFLLGGKSFKSIMMESEGYTCVSNDFWETSCHIVDKDGNIMCYKGTDEPITSLQPIKFSYGFALIHLKEAKYNFINKEMELMLPVNLWDAKAPNFLGLAEVYYDRQYYLMDSNCELYDIDSQEPLGHTLQDLLPYNQNG